MYSQSYSQSLGQLDKALCGLVCFITLFLSACVTTENEGGEPDSSSNNELVKASYGEANPLAPKELQQFGRLAGRWQCGLSEKRADGSWRPRPSSIIWTWFYTLSGYAVQDIWVPQSGASQAQVIATNLRMYDATTGQWNVAWSNTQQSSFELWNGGQIGDEMVLTSVRDQRPVRIRFFNLLPRRFQWSYEAASSLQSTEFTTVLQMQCFQTD